LTTANGSRGVGLGNSRFRRDRRPLSVNARLIDDPDVLANIRVQKFDGAKTWRVVQTRTLDEPGW